MAVRDARRCRMQKHRHTARLHVQVSTGFHRRALRCRRERVCAHTVQHERHVQWRGRMCEHDWWICLHVGVGRTESSEHGNPI
jgi:hypothetical protein